MIIYFKLYHIIIARCLVLRQLVGEEGPGADCAGLQNQRLPKSDRLPIELDQLATLQRARESLLNTRRWRRLLDRWVSLLS